MSDQPVATFTRTQTEVPRVRHGRPSYVWVEAYAVTAPGGIGPMQPYFRPREARSFCKEQGWKLVEVTE